MAFEHKPGSFALFKNDKGDNPKRPDYRGDGMDLEGNAIEVSAWIKEGGKGKFMSCNFKIKGQQQKPAPQPQKAAPQQRGGGSFSDMEDDIPF